MIDVIFIDNAEKLAAEYICFIEGLIGEEEKVKASRYRRWQDKQASLLGKLLVGLFLKKYNYNPSLLKQLSFTEFKRPFIRDIQADFNISHSGQVVVCACSHDQKIGVDIEQVQTIQLPDFKYILNDFDEEVIKTSDDKMAAFFKIWSAKEAILKAEGCGLVDDLYKLDVNNEKGYFNEVVYYLRTLDIQRGYSSCIASQSSIGDIYIEKVFIEEVVEKFR